jgi:hypothetical protein
MNSRLYVSAGQQHRNTLAASGVPSAQRRAAVFVAHGLAPQRRALHRAAASMYATWRAIAVRALHRRRVERCIAA